MALSNTIKREIPPTHPGEMLREDFMPDYGLSAPSLAAALGISRQSVNELLRERRAVTPVMALRLSRLFGNSPEFWLNAQRARDLWESGRRYRREIAGIRPLHAAPERR
jgi:addiction module HigA family antidote